MKNHIIISVTISICMKNHIMTCKAMSVKNQIIASIVLFTCMKS